MRSETIRFSDNEFTLEQVDDPVVTLKLKLSASNEIGWYHGKRRSLWMLFLFLWRNIWQNLIFKH